MGEISREEFEAMELADRRFNAFQIVDSPSNKAGLNMEVEALGSGSDIEFGSGNSGWLMYKRGKRRKYRRKVSFLRQNLTLTTNNTRTTTNAL